MADELTVAMAGLVGLLAEPTRLRIVAALQGWSGDGRELAQALEARPAVVAEQLEVLRAVGIVARGRHGHFRLVDPSIGVACAALPSPPAQPRVDDRSDARGSAATVA